MGIFTRSRPRAPARPTNPADALFTPVQQRVLGVLFCNPERSFTATEVTALAGADPGAVQRMLDRLEAGRLVVIRRESEQKLYQANELAPTFGELRALVLKTSGVTDVIRVALASRAAKIRAAFIFGPAASTQETSAGDVSLLVVSDTLIYADLLDPLADASRTLGRKIVPTLFSSRELARRMRANDSSTVKILAQPRAWLMGASTAESIAGSWSDGK